MFFYKRKPLCFYCGSKSPATPLPGARSWSCKACDAINHLDEDGNFTDVPVMQAPQSAPVQNRAAFSRSPSPEFEFGDDPIFCRKCLSNQHIYQQSLAEYLPEFDDPRYPEFEKALPEFKKNLGLRYPQVCVDCAPEAEKRLNKAVYAAKVDNARHMLQKSKQNERNIMALSLFNWKSIVIFVAGLLWWSSIFGQLLWHVAGLVFLPYTHAQTNSEYSNVGLVSQCAKEFGACSFTKQHLWNNYFLNPLDSPKCFFVFNMIAGWSFRLIWPSFWWNNRLRGKYIDKQLGRVKGLGEYYKLQSLVFLVRWSALKFLDHPKSLSLTLEAFRGAHMFLLIFFAVTTYQSRRLVYLDRSARLNFDKPHKLLVEEAEPQTKRDNHKIPNTASSRGHHVDPYHYQLHERQRREDHERAEAIVRARERAQQSAFPPYDRVAASLSRTQYNSTQTPPTPPPEDDGSTPTTHDSENAMEWSPTQPKFQPRRPVQPFVPPQSQQPVPAPKSDYKSPFYGTLPPAPLPPAFRLRNPRQPNFYRPSEERRNLFQDAIMRRNTDVGSSSSHNASSIGSTGLTDQGDGEERREMELRPSNWFLESDYVDTGLETAFEAVFSLDDTPREVERVERRRGGLLGGLLGRR
ncbi:MAG: hypothetical protein M1821_005974 [Bathelium mastoideum]|nr:MAG: hypothetical protein M1821_005974 [Bathelium mastoideum]